MLVLLSRHSFRHAAARRLSSHRISTLPQLPSLPVVASIVFGLPLALWAYKCCIMVVFQRRIIYMGYAPLGARQDRLVDVPQQYLRGIHCEEVEVEEESHVKLAGVLVKRNDVPRNEVEVVIVYFQGNAGNPLHRIPIFQYLCSSMPPTNGPKIAVLAVAPRSYWASSSRRPTQAGIISDYHGVLQYALRKFPAARISIYGHSLGGAAAICALAQLEDSEPGSTSAPEFGRIRGLILENPFTSIPGMVRALYPQKWLPYYHLTPFVLDKWDAIAALNAHVGRSHSVLGRISKQMLIFSSEYDEIVPAEMGTQIHDAASRCHDSTARRVVIPGALHENTWSKKVWLDEIKRYLQSLV